MKTIAAARLNQRITILKKASGQDSTYGTEQINWIPHCEAYADVQDFLPRPSMAETVMDGVTFANRPCRIRMRWRDDVRSDMRVKIGNRVLQIVAGPAELGWREGLELVAEEVSTLGNTL